MAKFIELTSLVGNTKGLYNVDYIVSVEPSNNGTAIVIYHHYKSNYNSNVGYMYFSESYQTVIDLLKQ